MLQNMPIPYSMHYLVRYMKFIDSIDNNRISIKETHHILPKCLGGSDDSNNLINLTPRQHFIAHWILWKAYKTKELTFAFFAMNNQNNKNQKRNFRKSSRIYEAVKAEFQENIKKSSTELWANLKYRKLHETTNQTEKTKKLRSDKAKQLWKNEEFRKKQNESRKLAWKEGRVNRDHSKCGTRGEANPSKNPEIVAKYSGENFFAKRPGYIMPKCIYCGLSATPGNIKRWHNDNCKKKPIN